MVSPISPSGIAVNAVIGALGTADGLLRGKNRHNISKKQLFSAFFATLWRICSQNRDFPDMARHEKRLVQEATNLEGRFRNIEIKKHVANIYDL